MLHLGKLMFKLSFQPERCEMQTALLIQKRFSWMLWGLFYTTSAGFIFSVTRFSTCVCFFLMVFCTRNFNGKQQTNTIIGTFLQMNALFTSENMMKY